MNRTKNLILSLSLLFGFPGILHGMESTDTTSYLKLLNEDIESLQEAQKTKKNQRFKIFSTHSRSYNIPEAVIEQFNNNFQDSIPYVYCQPSFFTRSSNFIQKAFLGSSAQEIKNAWKAARLIETISNHSLESIIKETFLNNKISNEMKATNLRAPENINIRVIEKNLYTENDNLDKDFPDKVSFAIHDNIINYTIEMNSLINELDPKHIPYRLAKTCTIIANSTLIKRPLRALFFNTLLIAPNVLLPFCKNILPYCKDKNSLPLVAAGCLTGILAAHYINRHFNQKEESDCISAAENLSGQKSVDYKYLLKFRRIENFQGTKDGRSYTLNIAGIKPIIPEM